MQYQQHKDFHIIVCREETYYLNLITAELERFKSETVEHFRLYEQTVTKLIEINRDGIKLQYSELSHTHHFPIRIDGDIREKFEAQYTYGLAGQVKEYSDSLGNWWDASKISVPLEDVVMDRCKTIQLLVYSTLLYNYQNINYYKSIVPKEHEFWEPLMKKIGRLQFNLTKNQMFLNIKPLQPEPISPMTQFDAYMDHGLYGFDPY